MLSSIPELRLLLPSPCSEAVEWAGRPLRGRGSSGDMLTWAPGKPDHSTHSSPPQRQANSCPLFPGFLPTSQLPLLPERLWGSGLPNSKGPGSKGCRAFAGAVRAPRQPSASSSERRGTPGVGTG